MIGKAITALLKADTTLTALIADKLYPQKLPQGTKYPAITFSLIDSGDFAPLCKGGPGADDLEIVQIKAYGETYSEAVEIAYAVRNVLRSYTGTSSGVSISSVSFEGWWDRYEEEAKAHVRVSEYNFHITNQ